MKEQLDKLLEKGYIFSYKIEDDDQLVIDYSLGSVAYTSRVIDISDKDLKAALWESGEDIRVDIESSLVDDDDFFGYDNEEELEDRIVEETNYLKYMSDEL